jgi:hypothetical protein
MNARADRAGFLLAWAVSAGRDGQNLPVDLPARQELPVRNVPNRHITT